MKARLLFAGFLFLIVFSLPGAYAQDFIAHQMRFTISCPVEFPGRILEAGTYFIRRETFPLRQGTDSVIEVLDENRHVLITTIGTYTKRKQPLPEAFEFYEVAQGTRPAVRSWFLPGQFDGYDFVYPKDRAAVLAQGVVQPVSATITKTVDVQPAAPQPAPEPDVKLPADEPAAVEKPSEPTPRAPVPPPPSN